MVSSLWCGAQAKTDANDVEPRTRRMLIGIFDASTRGYGKLNGAQSARAS